MMAPYIPAARRRPVLSAASSAASPAAILVMAAPSGRYTSAGTDYHATVPQYGMAIARPPARLGLNTSSGSRPGAEHCMAGEDGTVPHRLRNPESLADLRPAWSAGPTRAGRASPEAEAGAGVGPLRRVAAPP
jgi:hypothetical protein